MIGEVLGNRYEIEEKIGEGGMSVVYKARCNKLNRYVAVKILKKELADNEDIVSKFKKEATAIATLSDTNIVNVLDVGSQDNINYIVMEYVKGKTLKEVINQLGMLNYETTINVGLQIAKALDCAHKNNIIHRDVKPQNILVTEDGVIKVTDFGIAKSASSTTLTNTTTIMGSAHYFSPEQAKGSFVDARTDLYSLGVVLYEMVTGRLPFEADSPVTIALKHIQEEVVPPKQINSRIPDSLNKLIMKAMEKDPNKRYQTAREMINDLEKIKNNPDVVIDAPRNTDVTDHTIIMNPVNVDEEPVLTNKNVQDDYDDSEEDDDDDYDYDYDGDDEDDHDEERSVKRGPKKSKKKLIITIASIVAGMLLLGVGAYFLFSGGSVNKKDVQVPDLEGMTVQEAKDALQKLGLVYEEGGEQESDAPQGTVVATNPSKGTMAKEGDKVRVFTSRGKDPIKMIDVSDGGDVDTLNEFIKKNGLKAATITKEYSDDVDEGKIIRTTPEAGTEIDENTKITAVVSQGSKPKTVEVPDLTGLNESDAKEKLAEKGLKYQRGENTEVNDKNSDGLVVSQSIKGKAVNIGTTIRVSFGEYKEAKKPDKVTINLDEKLVKGMTYAGVNAALGSKVKLNITDELGNKIPEKDLSGKYLLEDWNPNGVVEEGSTVTLIFKEPNKVDE